MADEGLCIGGALDPLLLSLATGLGFNPEPDVLNTPMFLFTKI